MAHVSEPGTSFDPAADVTWIVFVVAADAGVAHQVASVAATTAARERGVSFIMGEAEATRALLQRDGTGGIKNVFQRRGYSRETWNLRLQETL